MNKTIWVLACMMVLVNVVNAQSYVVVSGSSVPITTSSNLMVDYALSTYDQTLEPGDTGTLTLVIKNTGSQRAEDVEVYIPDVPDFHISKSFFIGTVSALSSSSISVTYIISPNATVGIHNVPVQLQFDGYDSDSARVNNVKANFDFPIKVYGKPKLVVEKVDFGEIDVGSEFNVTIYVRNENMRAYKVTAGLGGAEQASTPLSQSASAMASAQGAAQAAGLSPLLQAAQSNPSLMGGLSALSEVASKASASDKAITILNSDRKYVGDIDTGQTIPVVFTVYVSDKAVSGAYTLPLTLEYENKGRTQATERFNIGVYVSGRPQIGFTNVKTDPEEIHQADKDVDVTLTVENIGTRDVDSFQMVMLPKWPFKNAKSYEQTKDLGRVKVRDASSVSFFVDVEDKVKPGLYALDFGIEYNVGTKSVNGSKQVQVAIKESPDFTLQAKETNVSAGASAKMQMVVTNDGKKCDSVTVWVMKKSDQPFDFDDKSQYIGDLDTGESGEAAITLSADDTAKEHSYQVPLEIRCTIDNKVETSSKSVKINVVAKEELITDVPLTLVGAGVIVLAVAAWFAMDRLRRPKAKKVD